jgi:phosphoglycerate dehydrogenase-like enzyme
VTASVLPKILVITPVQHIQGVPALLESIGSVTYLEDPSPTEALAAVSEYDTLYTNPNKSNVFISPELMDAAPKLRAICTASTGTNHIDVAYAAQKGIAVLALTRDLEVLERISSTAEHAFALMLAALRHIPQSFDSVKRGEWDYTQYVGRQLDHLTVGVVGCGRLGSMFARYGVAFGCRVLTHDPYRTVSLAGVEQVGLETLLRESDVISLHVHVTPETLGMVGREWFAQMKPSVVVVNTARGEVIDETAAMEFLGAHAAACLAADVIADEVRHKQDNPLIEFARTHANLILTPHIGGMTVEGQQIAYNHAARKLKQFFAEGG